MNHAPPHRILFIDDNPSIHEDFRKLFSAPDDRAVELEEMEAAVFCEPIADRGAQTFEISFASQGDEGLELVRAAQEQGRPFALSFVDVRMPPGWDGVTTVEQLWKVEPDLQVVICTAYTDYSWDDMRRRLGTTDSLLVLKKPFDSIEVLQLAHALTRKWELTREARKAIEVLDRRVAERTHSLECEMADRTRAEESLRQAKKMEAVGQLAAGIAHDFNNLLTIIRGNVDLLALERPAEVGPDGCISQIFEASNRAAALVRQLLAFSRRQVTQRHPLDLNALLDSASVLLRRGIAAHIDIRLLRAESAVGTLADQGSLDQVIMNLALNARDAMPHGGTLTLQTSVEMLDDTHVSLHPEARTGKFACLTVTDTGLGMDSATLSRIFEPFFTTKEVGKGTGLGLATVFGVVQQHQGWVEVESQPGHGSTFRVYLPWIEYSTQASSPEPGRPEPDVDGASGRTILVVEDEPGVLKFARSALALGSFRVLAATDGLEAMRIWSENAGRVDLLFTDMVMPNGVSGRALADRLLTERPNLKVIYASGYSPETLDAEWLEAAHVGFLPKPYTTEALLRTVASSLAAA